MTSADTAPPFTGAPSRPDPLREPPPGWTTDAADGVYRLLVEAQRGLDPAETAAFHARLVLALAAEIHMAGGGRERLAAIVALARDARPPG